MDGGRHLLPDKDLAARHPDSEAIFLGSQVSTCQRSSIPHANKDIWQYAINAWELARSRHRTSGFLEIRKIGYPEIQISGGPDARISGNSVFEGPGAQVP